MADLIKHWYFNPEHKKVEKDEDGKDIHQHEFEGLHKTRIHNPNNPNEYVDITGSGLQKCKDATCDRVYGKSMTFTAGYEDKVAE